MFQVITIGDTTFDTFVQIDSATIHYKKNSHRPEWLSLNYADKICIDDITQSVGGNAGNVSVGLKRLGLDVAIVTEVGDDFYGHTILNELGAAGVNTKLADINKKRETRYSIVLNHKGERTILCYHAKRSYKLPPLPASKWIYYTSMGPSFEKVQTKILSFLKKNPETKLAFNPGSYQMKEGLKTIQKILPFVDLLFVNKEEAEVLTGKKGPLPALIKILLKKGIGAVVITDGIKGSAASLGEEIEEMGIYAAPLVSKTGAGDAYASGFLGAYSQGKSLKECMLSATANAASVTGHLGAHTGLLNASQIKKFIATHRAP